MKSKRHYTEAEINIMRDLYKKGWSYDHIGIALGRTRKAIENQVSRRGWIPKKTPQISLKQPRKKSASYIRYEKPKTSLTLLWGLVKFEKS